MTQWSLKLLENLGFMYRHQNLPHTNQMISVYHEFLFLFEVRKDLILCYSHFGDFLCEFNKFDFFICILFICYSVFQYTNN